MQRIARQTHGVHDLTAVEAEAWILAEHIHRKRGTPIDWANPEDQDLLLGYLYQHLVRYAEHNIDYAVRLDHWNGGDDESEPHPILNKLVADGGADPLSTWIEREEMPAPLNEPHCHHSIAGAYIHLLRHFDNRMKAVADHLLISISYCYAHYAKVRALTESQCPIPIHQASHDKHFLPGPWRRFRIRREPQQLEFDFEVEPPLAFALT